MIELANINRRLLSAARLRAAPAVLALATTLTALVVLMSGPQPAQAQAPSTSGIVLDEKQTAAVKSVAKYFNDLKQLKGTFRQTNADKKLLRGKFFIKQPGRFRFDYGFGSKMVIVSDGKYLSIQDNDLNTENSWELDRTPFRLLLRKDVDLTRDATILDVQDSSDLIILSVQDKSPDTPGKIKLIFVKTPALELKEWVTTDAQGLDTQIEIADLSRTEEIADAIFTPQSPALRKLQQNQ